MKVNCDLESINFWENMTDTRIFCSFAGKAFQKAGLDSVLTDLKGMGHKVDNSPEKLGILNVISQKDKQITTFADERSDGGSIKF